MKPAGCILWLGLLPGVASWAQPRPEPTEPRRLEVGVDLLKTPTALIGMPASNFPLKKESFLTLESLARIEHNRRGRWWQAQLGFTRYTGAPTNSTYLNLTGGFLKAGSEWPVGGEHTIVGLLLTAAAWQTDGDVRVPAVTFGGYRSPIPAQWGGAVGLELQTNRDVRLNEHWLVRLGIRYNVFWRMTPPESIRPRYLPGLGLYLTKPDAPASAVGFTGGVAVQLFYTINRKRAYPALVRQPFR